MTFYEISFDAMLPFIRHCKRLKTIKTVNYASNDDLDLVVLNQERKKFGEEASQVLIRVSEDIYLREKWNSKNVELNHVKIARFLHLCNNKLCNKIYKTKIQINKTRLKRSLYISSNFSSHLFI